MKYLVSFSNQGLEAASKPHFSMRIADEIVVFHYGSAKTDSDNLVRVIKDSMSNMFTVTTVKKDPVKAGIISQREVNRQPDVEPDPTIQTTRTELQDLIEKPSSEPPRIATGVLVEVLAKSPIEEAQPLKPVRIPIRRRRKKGE